jgi:hypothetical protein
MDVMSLIIIILLLGFIFYKEHEGGKERKDLQLKLMSKDVAEYISAVEKDDESPESVEDPYIPAEDLTADQIHRAGDST